MSCGCYDSNGIPLVNCNGGCAPCDPTNAVGLPDCPPSAESCEDILYGNCVKYVGPNLPALGITNGMRLKAALIALNTVLNTTVSTKAYTITVTTSQNKTTVEYIDIDGALQTAVVSSTQSPVTICARINTPVIISGTGTIVNTGVNC